MKAILTSVGQNKIGILAEITTYLAKQNINVLDLSQTIMNDFFTMMVSVELPEDIEFVQVIEDLNKLGAELGLDINIKNADIYRAMHTL